MAAKVSFQDDRLRVDLEQRDERLWLALTDLSRGRVWGPAPLLALEVHDKTLRREDRLERYRIDAVEPCDGGAHVTVGDGYHHVAVGLWLRLRAGELAVLLAMPEVYESKPAHFRLFAVDLLPGLLTVSGDGALLMPPGGGTLCHPRGKPRAADRFLIYLEQDRWELGTTLPYGAVYDDQGGIVMLATQGAADAQCRVATDGEGRGEMNFAFSLRRHWPDPVDGDNRELRFVPIPAKADPVLFAAKRLRRHIVDDLGKKTIKARAAESPELAYLLDAYLMKAFHARENEGLEMADADKSNPVSFVLGMTFDECRQGLTRCKEAGIEKIQVHHVGWNARGHDGLYPARFPVDERLGGEAGFREWIAYGHDVLGYRINVHDNFSMNIPHAPNFDPDVLIRDVYGEPLVSGWWAGGLEYQSWGLALPYDRLTGHLERMKALGMRGLYYCDYMLRPLEVNYHPTWRGPRADSARGQVRVLKEAQRLFGAVAAEYGILPACIACDYVCYAGARGGDSRWPVAGLMDKAVPVWELTLQGLMLSEQTGVNWASAMRAVLFGKHIRDEWTYRVAARQPELTPQRIQAQKAMYDLCIKRFGHLQAEEITGYREPAPQVIGTTFADGTEVTADFAAQELHVNGQPVARPAALAPKAGR